MIEKIFVELSMQYMIIYCTQVAKFEFSIYTVPDGLYGVFDHETNQWNGIVRELIDRKADIAVAPMTINYAR